MHRKKTPTATDPDPWGWVPQPVIQSPAGRVLAKRARDLADEAKERSITLRKKEEEEFEAKRDSERWIADCDGFRSPTISEMAQDLQSNESEAPIDVVTRAETSHEPQFHPSQTDTPPALNELPSNQEITTPGREDLTWSVLKSVSNLLEKLQASDISSENLHLLQDRLQDCLRVFEHSEPASAEPASAEPASAKPASAKPASADESFRSKYDALYAVCYEGKYVSNGLCNLACRGKLPLCSKTIDHGIRGDPLHSWEEALEEHSQRRRR